MSTVDEFILGIASDPIFFTYLMNDVMTVRTLSENDNILTPRPLVAKRKLLA